MRAPSPYFSTTATVPSRPSATINPQAAPRRRRGRRPERRRQARPGGCQCELVHRIRAARQGYGSFARRSTTRPADPDSVAIGDLNADGRPDLATANGNGGDSVSVLLNRGGGQLRGQAGLSNRRQGGPVSIAIGDLNGDGEPDLATANQVSSPSNVSVLLNRGNGTFQTKRGYLAGRGEDPGRNRRSER